jgi:hypothetical protein
MPAGQTRRIGIWNVLLFLLGLALLAWLLTQVDFPALWRQVSGTSPAYFLLGGLLYLVKTALRALRIQRINRRSQPTLLAMLRLVLAVSLATQILPLKLGEFTYVYLLNRDRRASLSAGLSSLLIVRLLDLLAIGLLFILVSLVLGLSASTELSRYFTAVLVFIALLAAAILSLLIVSRCGEKLLDSFFALPWLPQMPLLVRIHAGLTALFNELARYTNAEILEWMFISLMEWFVNYYAFHILLQGIGLAPTFYTTVITVTFAALTSVLPFNSFGSFGTLEAGWAAGMILMGYPRQVAISSGFAAHLLTMAYMILLGGLSWLTYLAPARPGKSQM